MKLFNKTSVHPVLNTVHLNYTPTIPFRRYCPRRPRCPSILNLNNYFGTDIYRNNSLTIKLSGRLRQSGHSRFVRAFLAI